MEQCHDHIRSRNYIVLCIYIVYIVYLWFCIRVNFNETFANKQVSSVNSEKNAGSGVGTLEALTYMDL